MSVISPKSRAKLDAIPCSHEYLSSSSVFSSSLFSFSSLSESSSKESSLNTSLQKSYFISTNRELNKKPNLTNSSEEDIHTLDIMLNSKLHLAVKEENSTVISQLLEMGIECNKQNIIGNTALHELFTHSKDWDLSLENNKIKVFQKLNIALKLLQHKADIHIKNIEDFTPLDILYRTLSKNKGLLNHKKELCLYFLAMEVKNSPLVYYINKNWEVFKNYEDENLRPIKNEMSSNIHKKSLGSVNIPVNDDYFQQKSSPKNNEFFNQKKSELLEKIKKEDSYSASIKSAKYWAIKGSNVAGSLFQEGLNRAGHFIRQS